MTFANRNRGGSGVYARSLLASLREREDVAAWVIAGPSRSNPMGTLRWLVAGARKAIDSKPPDILHCPSFVAPWRVPRPFVVTVHDAATRRAPGDHPLEWRLYDRALMPARLRAASRVIVGSQFARGEVIEAYGLNPDRVVAVPYGLNARLFAPLPDVKPSGPGGPMLFLGKPVGRKNLDAILHCMASSAGSAVGRAALQISGARGQDFPAYSALIRSLGLGSRVHWLGHVSEEEMPAVIANASVVVYPSLYEGFGFPPLEAMAVGTPVVASNRGSLPEVLDDAALLVDPTAQTALGEAIEAVLTRPDLRERLTQAGRARARTFTWEKCATKTVEVYRSVLAESGVRAA
jgi:glycosyltransferase involved in cell wall biosynthesis